MEIIGRHKAYFYLREHNEKVTEQQIKEAMARAEKRMKSDPDIQASTTCGFHLVREDDDTLRYWVDPLLGGPK